MNEERAEKLRKRLMALFEQQYEKYRQQRAYGKLTLEMTFENGVPQAIGYNPGQTFKE